MKKIIILIFICIVCNNLFSQVDYDDEKVSGFASLDVSSKFISGNTAIFTGGSCGIIINDIRLGAFVNGVTSKFKFKDKNDVSRLLACMQGGISIGYSMLKKGNFCPVADLRLSFGQASIINTDFERTNEMVFWGIAPRLGIGYKISELFLIELGVNYQYSILYKPPILYDENFLNSLGFYLSLKLGKF
jgi:hypothetical protein